MKRRALLAAALLAGGAHAAPGLTTVNFVEVGDVIVDMLDANGIALASWMMGGALGTGPSPVAFGAPRAMPRSEPFEAACPGGGSVRGRFADRDASGDLSVQDRFVTVFDDCRVDGEVVTGSSEFVVAGRREDAREDSVELEFRFHDLGSDAMRWSGAARIALRSDRRTGSEGYVVAYRDLVVRRGERSYRLGLRLQAQVPPLGDMTARFDGPMWIGALALKLRQDEPFVMPPGGPPRAGTLTATDPHGARLQLEAGPWRYAYRYFARDNAGLVPDSSSQSEPHARRR